MAKKAPLAILKSLKEIADKNKHLVILEKDENEVLHFKDVNEDTKFYFKIKNINVSGSKTTYSIEYIPFNPDNFELRRHSYDIKQLQANFKNWINLLREYDEIEFELSDPILKYYQEELEKDFRLVDEDADIVPFNMEKQIWIDGYLDKVIEIVEAKKNNDNVIEVAEIISDAKSLKKQLHKITKNQVVGKLRKIWAKSWKVGVNVVKELFIDFTTELAKKLIQGE